jgi:hypothetical protein
MAAAGAVGDPACTVSSFGATDPALIPVGVSSIGVGQTGDYHCLVF